jgi:large conductance mechanosensitive channel
MEKIKSFAKEFKEFLKEYKIVGLAIAFIMGMAATTLMKSLVDNVIMPLITPFIAGGAWREAILTLGPILIKWGQFLADFLYFLILALLVFLFAKYFLKEEKVAKK